MKVTGQYLCEMIEDTFKPTQIKGLNISNSIYSKEYPFVQDIGILYFFKDFKREKNNLYLELINESGEVVVTSLEFRITTATKDGLGVIGHNIKGITFTKKDEKYIIRLYNCGEKINDLEIKSYNKEGKPFELLELTGVIEF